MPLDTEIAWCAGFFDGEGHVSYFRSCPSEASGLVTKGMRCSVSQKADNVEVLIEFQRIVALGKVTRTYDMPNGKPQHRLIFGIKEVEPLFNLLKPYLKSEKTLAFQNALTGYEFHDSTPTAEDWGKLVKRKEKKYKKMV